MASASPSSCPTRSTGFGYLVGRAVVAPDKTDEVQKAIAEAAAELRAKPISDDLLARARTRRWRRLTATMRENGYWLAALRARRRPSPSGSTASARRRRSSQSVTAADLQKLARNTVSRTTPSQQVRIVSSRARHHRGALKLTRQLRRAERLAYSRRFPFPLE